MKRVPPWWLRAPILLDWIGLSFFLVGLTAQLAADSGDRDIGRIVLGILVAAGIMTLDAFGGLGRAWALLPRAGLAFPAIFWCLESIGWNQFDIEDAFVVGIGLQQVWVLVACLGEEVRRRVGAR